MGTTSISSLTIRQLAALLLTCLRGAPPSAGMSSNLNSAASGANVQPGGDIKSFNKDTKDLHGYLAHSTLNLKHNISKKEKAKGSTHNFEHFGISSRASVRAGDRHIAVGTDDPEATQHFLSVVDGRAMDDARADPVVCYTPVSEHMSDVKWLNATTLLAATGRGNLKLFQFDGSQLKHVGDMADAAGSYIREMAVQPGVPNNVAIGGFDHKLNFLDLNRPDNPYVQRLDMQAAIGSVKWAPFNANAYVSCALDEGKYYLFDSRLKITESAFYIDLKQEDLFAHERYGDFNVMLGFGDGKIKHVDMRQAKTILHTEQDPYVDAIGGIEYNQASGAFVTSGYTDFSVFKVANGEAKIWSHSKGGDEVLRGKGWACSAAWYDATTTVCTDNAGTLSLHIQDF